MRIQPVEHYRAPALPLAAWTVADPEEHAARCGLLLRLLAGAGLLGSTLLLAGAGCRENAADPAAPPTPRSDWPPMPGGIGDAAIPPTPAEAAEALFRIAPNLLDAMVREGLGRGATGCVATDPPSFVSEEEGVAIVRAELEKAGLLLAEGGPVAPAVRQPQTTTQGFVYRMDNNKPPPEYQDAATPFTFDGASADGRVVFEYVSQKDFTAWEAKGGPWSTVNEYDLVPAAQRLAASLAQTPDSGRRIVVLVCDPAITYNSVRGDLDYPKPDKPGPARRDFPSDEAHRAAYQEWINDPEYQRRATEYHAEIRRRLREAGHASIVRQLAPQIDYLREQGLLPPAPAPDATPKAAAPAAP